MAMHYSAIPFFFLPRGIVATVLPITVGRALLFSFAQVGRQLFTDACWAARWTIRRLKSQERRPDRPIVQARPV